MNTEGLLALMAGAVLALVVAAIFLGVRDWIETRRERRLMRGDYNG